MAHRFRIKDIAFQAGLGTATVDRALNRSGQVRQSTLDRVNQAIAELEQQRQQLAMTGRKLVIDVIVEAPQTFLDALSMALTRELPLQRPAVFRARQFLHARLAPDAIEAQMARARKRVSDGVILMAPETGLIKTAVDRLEDVGIPVVTLATDMEGTKRTAYVGLDNRVAGASAAWFVGRSIGIRSPHMLVTIRNERFRGEEAREAGFRDALRQTLPGARITTLTEGDKRAAFLDAVTAAARLDPFDGLYSVGGGNIGLLATLEAAGNRPSLVIAHDVDGDNRALFKAGQIDLLLYHDLAEDIRNAARIIMERRLTRRVALPFDNAALRVLLPPMAANLPDE